MNEINDLNVDLVKLKEVDKLLLSLKNAADLVDLSPRTLSRFNITGNLRLYKLGGKVYVKLNEFKEDIYNMLEPV
ncbi:MAG: hypothetical protein KDC85_18235 [Saprospiraceae bacterium]|nr:hypothetical protein [Saprospiraceae bacterium]MCB9325874.1 hypothetical protein [Lewinellaceae bacterium]